MKLRIVVDLGDDRGPAAATMAQHALMRFSHALVYLGQIPSGVSTLWANDKVVGHASLDVEDEKSPYPAAPAAEAGS